MTNTNSSYIILRTPEDIQAYISITKFKKKCQFTSNPVWDGLNEERNFRRLSYEVMKHYRSSYTEYINNNTKYSDKEKINVLRDIEITMEYYKTNKSLRDIAKEYNRSMERIRQIKAKITRNFVKWVNMCECNLLIGYDKGSY